VFASRTPDKAGGRTEIYWLHPATRNTGASSAATERRVISSSGFPRDRPSDPRCSSRPCLRSIRLRVGRCWQGVSGSRSEDSCQRSRPWSRRTSLGARRRGYAIKRRPPTLDPARSSMSLLAVTRVGPTADPRRCRLKNDNSGADGLLNREAVLCQFRTLHLFAHPSRQHAPACPLQALILLRLILGFWFLALASAGNAHHGSDGRCRFV